MATKRSSAAGYHLYGGAFLVAVGVGFYDWRAGIVFAGVFMIWLAHAWVK